jgi:carbon storage regulator
MVRYTRYVRGSAILLVLARKAQQEIMIGDNIVVNIVKVSGNKIKIGITAPAGVSVYRSECRPELDQGCSEQPQEKNWINGDLNQIRRTKQQDAFVLYLFGKTYYYNL